MPDPAPTRAATATAAAARHAPVEAVVTAVRPAGGHDVLSLVVPDEGPWAGARPGQFVVLPRDPAQGQVLPDPLWLAGLQADPLHGTTIELIVPARREVLPGARMRLVGPLGRGFPVPSAPQSVLLVGQDDGAVPLRWLAEVLRARGHGVHALLSAQSPEGHIDLPHLRHHARSVVLTDPDDLMAALVRLLTDPVVDPAVVYAATPRPLLRRVARTGLEHGRAVRVAALDLGAPVVCGTGLCGACDLVVAGSGPGRSVRPCLEGPVVDGALLAGAEGEGERG